MLNEDKIESIVKFYDIDEELQLLINEIVDENYHEVDINLYDGEGKFYYTDVLINFFRKNERINTLTVGEFEILLDITIKYIIYRVESKGNAHIKASNDAYEDEYRNYYGGTENAYWHLLEKYFEEFNCNKLISEFYSEYCEEKGITR